MNSNQYQEIHGLLESSYILTKELTVIIITRKRIQIKDSNKISYYENYS